jgi:predicted ATPase
MIESEFPKRAATGRVITSDEAQAFEAINQRNYQAFPQSILPEMDIQSRVNAVLAVIQKA